MGRFVEIRTHKPRIPPAEIVQKNEQDVWTRAIVGTRGGGCPFCGELRFAPRKRWFTEPTPGFEDVSYVVRIC